MKPKPFEIIVEFTPQSTKTGITYEMHPKEALIRCKDCKHRPHKDKYNYIVPPRVQVGVYEGEPEYDDDMTCPYVCDDSWYSRIPGDEQYCDRAERKVNDDNS